MKKLHKVWKKLVLVGFMGCYLFFCAPFASWSASEKIPTPIPHTQMTETKVLRVATLNAYLLCFGPNCLAFEAPRIEERIRRIGQWVKAKKIDVLLVQEVWAPDQFEQLKKSIELPYAVYFGESSDQATFSRYPLTGERYIPSIWQGSDPEACGKRFLGYRYGIGMVDLEWQGQKIPVGNVHPVARRRGIPGYFDYEDQIASERKLMLWSFWNAVRDQAAQGPLLIGGDFNKNHASGEYEFFYHLTGMTDALLQNPRIFDQPALKCTFCFENPLNAVKSAEVPGYQINPRRSLSEGILDHVFITPDFQVTDARIDFPSPPLSDHQPVIMDLKLQARTRPLRHPMPEWVREQAMAIDAYVDTVVLSPRCYLNWETLWTQKRQSRKFIQSQLAETP